MDPEMHREITGQTNERIHLLEVEINEVYVIKAGLELLIVAAAAGLDRHVDAVLAALLAHREQELGLHQRFAAGEGHATAGVLEVIAILINLLEKLINCVILAEELSRFSGTHTRTGSAAGAFFTVIMQGTVLVERDRAAFAHLCAEAAAHAFCSVEGDLGVEVDRLRIGAPEAVQTATLEKDCGAHPSAVMNGALLNVYYSPSQFFHINLPSIFI